MHFSDGLVIRVIVRENGHRRRHGAGADSRPMTPPPATPLCFYDYHCPDGHLVLTETRMQERKAGSAAGTDTGRATARRSPAHRGSMDATPMVHSVLATPGQPLDAATREFFSSRFGHDFANVRVHADAGAAELARRQCAGVHGRQRRGFRRRPSMRREPARESNFWLMN